MRQIDETTAAGIALMVADADRTTAGWRLQWARWTADRALPYLLWQMHFSRWLEDAAADARLCAWALCHQTRWQMQRDWDRADDARRAERVAFNLRTFGQTTIPAARIAQR